MKNLHILVATLFLFIATPAISQTITQGEPTQGMREKATEEIEMWSDELGLTSKQADLMERKILEFAIKKDQLLQSKMREEAKTERLKALQISQHRDMRDILTKPQFERYLTIQQERMEAKEDEKNEKGN